MAGDGASLGTMADAIGPSFKALLRLLADEGEEPDVVLDWKRRALIIQARKLCSQLGRTLSLPIDAEDVVQETLLRAAKVCDDQEKGVGSDRVRRDNIHQYLWGIMRHVAQEHCRLLFRFDRELPDWPAPGPPHLDESVELKSCVCRCLSELDPQDRDLLGHYYSEDIELKELAARMGISYNALRQRKFDVLKRLRMCCDRCRKSNEVQM